MKKIIEIIKKNKFWILFALVMLVAVFLRTYNFNDWLRFSHDQARDARIITDVLNNKAPLPLLGPKAGGTAFLLGPMYYYFSIISGKIFGNYPDKFAYPSLFFSILAIPLLFLVMREYFNRKISIGLMAIMSVAYFFVVRSRFSSNPNLVPFFLLFYLLALLRIMDEKNKNALLWSALAGIALGIGIQLHTMYLAIMPIVTVLVFANLLIRKIPGTWKKLLLLVVMALIMNAAQIYSETTSNWQNAKNFMAGFHEKSTKNKSVINSMRWVSACQIQANFHMLTSLQDNDTCDTILKAPSKKFAKNIPFYLKLILDALFSLIGYLFLISAFRKEDDVRKKNFLGLMLLLNLIAFGIFIIVAKFLVISYFVIILPIPFVLLGLMLKSISERRGYSGKFFAVSLVVACMVFGLTKDYQAARDYEKGMGNNSESTTLGDVESISRYLLYSSTGYDKLYLTGSKEIVGRFNSPLQYFIQESGKTMILSWQINNKIIEPGYPMFYIENNSKDIVPGRKMGGREVISGEKFFQQTVQIIKN
jgi:4-amino-4-deoxy-L-arabinose transferase-like glycosyltransferase